MGVGTEEGLCFDVGFLVEMVRVLQCLNHAYIWRGLDIKRIKMRHLKLKGENKWKNWIIFKWTGQWTLLEGSKQRIYCSRIEYSIFLQDQRGLVRLSTAEKCGGRHFGPWTF